jgi:hypothetical protein
MIEDIHKGTQIKGPDVDLDFLPVQNIPNGVRIKAFAMRRNYETEKNKNHGWVLVSGTIKVSNDGQRTMIIDKAEKNKWTAPIGSETCDQNLFSSTRFITEILQSNTTELGNIFPEIIKPTEMLWVLEAASVDQSFGIRSFRKEEKNTWKRMSAFFGKYHDISERDLIDKLEKYRSIFKIFEEDEDFDNYLNDIISYEKTIIDRLEEQPMIGDKR